MVLDIEDVSFHLATTLDLDPEMEVDKTQKEDKILIEAHDWLSSNMSVNLFLYQLRDQALQKNLVSIPQPKEQYLWVPKVNGLLKLELSIHTKWLDMALEK
ncbi:hypothetical protein IWQ61_010529, partial [Dispira simplex]